MKAERTQFAPETWEANKPSMSRTFKCSSFADAMLLAGLVARAAEDAPESDVFFDVTDNQVRVQIAPRTSDILTEVEGRIAEWIDGAYNLLNQGLAPATES